MSVILQQITQNTFVFFLSFIVKMCMNQKNANQRPKMLLHCSSLFHCTGVYCRLKNKQHSWHVRMTIHVEYGTAGVLCHLCHSTYVGSSSGAAMLASWCCRGNNIEIRFLCAS